MGFDAAFAWSITPAIMKSLGTTLLITALSCVCAAFLGFGMEVIRRASTLSRHGMRFVIDAIRSTPMLVQLYFLYYVLPVYGIKLSALTVGVIALSIYYSGYLAEVFKAGIDGVPRGQIEAAEALGLRGFQITLLILAPQMLRNIAAPMGSYFISIFKSTPYLAMIAVPDSFGVALEIASETFRYNEPLAVAGAIFLTIAVTFSHLIHRLEKRLGRAHQR